jgi:hypothetical protein
VADIFLSYNRDDQARAKLFAEAFEHAGLKVWWDTALSRGEAFDHVGLQVPALGATLPYRARQYGRGVPHPPRGKITITQALRRLHRWSVLENRASPHSDATKEKFGSGRAGAELIVVASRASTREYRLLCMANQAKPKGAKTS